MPSIFNAQLSELGDTYLVNNIILTESKYILPNSKYVNLPNEVALCLKNELNQGKLIKIKKELVDNPKSKDIPLTDFTIEIPKTIDQRKSAERARVNKRISAYTALLSAFDIFEFFVVSAKLKSYGFNVFNEDKKEEVYLSIIEKGDEDLITDLERFLQIKDVFDRMIKKHRGVKQYLREIDACDTDEEIDEVIKSNRGWLVN